MTVVSESFGRYWGCIIKFTTDQLVIRTLRKLKQPEEENNEGCKRKADEMEGEPDPESSEAE